MVLHIIDGVLFITAMTFMDQFTIMVSFMKQVFDNSFVLSLVPASIVIGFNFPGLFTSWFAKRAAKRKIYIAIMGFLQRLMVFFLALTTYWILPLPATSGAAMVLSFYFLFAFMGGITFPAWIDLFAKTVPPKRRGRVTALRLSLASVVGIIVPLWMGPFLAANDFPGNYRVVFFIAFALVALSFVAFINIKEEGESPVSRQSFGEYIRDLLGLLLKKRFRHFILARFFFSFTFIAISFYTAYALKLFPSIDEREVAIFALLFNFSKAGFGYLLGYLGDRFNNLLVQKIGILAAVVSLVLVLLFPVIPVFYLLFVLIGITFSADSNALVVMIAEFGDEGSRISYTAVSSGIIGTSCGLIPVIMGMLISQGLVTYAGSFVIALVGSLISLVLFFRFSHED